MCGFDLVVYIVLGVVQFRNLGHVTHVYPFCYLFKGLFLKDSTLTNQVVDRYEFNNKFLYKDIINFLRHTSLGTRMSRGTGMPWLLPSFIYFRLPS